MRLRQRNFLVKNDINSEVLNLILNRVKLIAGILPIKRANFVGISLKNTGFLESLFGSDIKSIQKGGFKIPGTELGIVYQSRDKFHPIEEEIAIFLGLDSDEIINLECEALSNGFICIHIVEREIAKWAKITQASDLEKNTNLNKYPIPNKIVLHCLFALDSINKQSQLSLHSSDKDRVATYVQTLLDYGIEFDVDEIESYLFSTMSWDKMLINLVLDIFTKMKSGARVQYKPLGKSSEFYNNWSTK